MQRIEQPLEIDRQEQVMAKQLNPKDPKQPKATKAEKKGASERKASGFRHSRKSGRVHGI